MNNCHHNRKSKIKLSTFNQDVTLISLFTLLTFFGWPQYQQWHSARAEALEQAESVRQAQAEADEEATRLRGEVEVALAAGDLTGAGRLLSELEGRGASAADLRARYEGLASAREARARAGEAEVLREDVAARYDADGEGLRDAFQAMESAWRTAERATGDGAWGEALSGYDRVLREGHALLQLKSERESARETRAAVESLLPEVRRLVERTDEAEARRGLASAEAGLREGMSLYDRGAFAEASAKFEEAGATLRQAQGRAEAVLAERQPRLRLVAVVNGREVPATVRLGDGREFRTPQVFALNPGDTLRGEVTYEAGGVRYRPERVELTADWRGVREHRVVLEEMRGPVRGQDYSVDLGGGVKMEFVWIGALNAWVGKYEVTNGEFRRFRSGHNSGEFTRNNRTLSLNGDRQPVVQVSYNDAVAFTQWLSGRSGVGEHGVRARLLTGDEWTAIARCGTNREFPWGDSWPPTRGNYSDLTAREQLGFTGIDGYRDGFGVTAPVDQSGRNEWGLYGVGGNVWEWTSEQSGSSRVLRGASWSGYSRGLLRVEYRHSNDPSRRHITYGFRVLLSP